MTFTLRSLMGITTAIALLIAWGMLVCYGTPQATLLFVILTSAALSMIVGYRRFGSLSARIRVALLFFVGGVIISNYSRMLTGMLSENGSQADSHDHFRSLVFLVFGFPVVSTVGIFMLRAWLWSANDGSVYSADNELESSSTQ